MGEDNVESMRHLDSEIAARRLVGSWLTRSDLDVLDVSDVSDVLDDLDGPEPRFRWDAEIGPDARIGPDAEIDPDAGTRSEPSTDDADPGTGLAVPPAPARDVIAAACRVAIAGRKGGPSSVPSPAIRLIAEAMVLDEHPSACDWTPAERRDALHWITLIVHRLGEDGVQRLAAELDGRP